MYVTLLATILLTIQAQTPSHPKEPINKNISTNLHKSQTSDKTNRQTRPSVATNTPSDQTEPTHKTNDNENYPGGITYRIESAPQPEGWFKGYVIATFVIAAFNFGTLVFLGWQLSIMRLEQRAWVFIGIPHCDGLEDYGSKKLTVRIKIGNTGRTPAKHVARNINISLAERGKEPTFVFPEPKGANAVVFPNGEIVARSSIDCTNDMRIGISAGEIFVWVNGKVVYEDIFGRKHWIKFCFVMDAPGKQRFKAHTEHNEIDT